MITLSDIVAAIQDDLTVGDESTLYNPSVIKRAINRAYSKVGALFPWSELQDAKKTTTQTDQNYYDYPQNWRSNSIWKLTIDDVRYGEDPDGSPLSFDDFLNWKEDNPDSTDKKWANQWRRFFVSPTPTVGGLVIVVWGIKVIADLSSDSDVTIFSYSTPECNEAIELEAMAILKSKGDNDNSAQFKSLEAKQIATTAWNKIAKEQAKYEKIAPFFEVPNFFGVPSTVKDLRGRFE